MIKILHAADLHLDSAFHGLSPEKAALRRAEQRQMLRAIAEMSNEHGCDLMLLAGDIFDSAEVYPDTLEALGEAFATVRAQIFIAPGNHDSLGESSPYRTEKWPENVHIFTSPQISSVGLSALGCRVWGAGFTAQEAPALLRGFAAEQTGLVNLMVLHGDCENPKSPYNPVAKEDIAGSSLDYLALGHIHRRADIRRAGDTFYGWPGCAMGRGFDETGEKGVYIGTVERGSVDMAFYPLPVRRCEILRVPAGDDAENAIRNALPEGAARDIYRVILTGAAEPPDLITLHKSLAPLFYSLQLRDETTPIRDLWTGAGEDTLRGRFLATLKDAARREKDDAQKEILRLAATLGVRAMEGREEGSV